jgi:mRNA interferase YafQ
MFKLIKTKKYSKAIYKILRAARDREKMDKEIEGVILKLCCDEKLDAKYRDHQLVGNFKDFRECHIRPDLLLMYQKDGENLILVLVNIGSHSQLF